MEALLTHCSAEFSQHGRLLATFFLGGVAGGLTHCLVMCGPIVTCQSACGSNCVSSMSAASQWHYHAGRLITYGALGFFAALLSQQFAASRYWPVLSALMMVTAGVIFLMSALLPGRHGLFSPTPGNFLLRGALMSFMPCGLIYAALMMAATLANPVLGMVAMWFFVLGTIPALAAASGSATILAARWQDAVRRIGRCGMAFNGLTLLVMAARSMK